MKIIQEMRNNNEHPYTRASSRRDSEKVEMAKEA
jgi:hypothetical protein